MSNPERYDAVAAVLPAELPAVDRRHAQRIATAIVRKFWPTRPAKGYQYGITGVRRVWISKTPTRSDNHDKGLGRLVHDLSHDVFEATYYHKRPHDPLHVQYEMDVAAFVAERIPSWFAPPKPKAPKPKPTATEKRSKRYALTVASIKRWDAKRRRAENALKKLRRSARAQQRAMYEHDMRPLVCPKTGEPKRCNDQMCCY